MTKVHWQISRKKIPDEISGFIRIFRFAKKFPFYSIFTQNPPKNTVAADDFVPIDETYTENGKHTVLENKIPLVDIKKKSSKKAGGKQDVQISLGRGNLIEPRDQKGKSFRELINGINDQQPLGQDDIERMILEKGKQAKEQEPDAYKDTFLPGQQVARL